MLSKSSFIVTCIVLECRECVHGLFHGPLKCADRSGLDTITAMLWGGRFVGYL